LHSEKEIRKHVFSLTPHSGDDVFNQVSLAVFKFQASTNRVYRSYLSNLKVNPDSIHHYTRIPFLPIEFFKSQEVICNELQPSATCFTSSGTTGQAVSRHFVNDISVYQHSFEKCFEMFYGNPGEYCILALLPNYLERAGSSLVYMCDHLIRKSGHPKSGFYLHNLDELIQTIHDLKELKQKTLLLGVSYALMDLAERDVKLDENFIVMETGGMKGKRKELLKVELHAFLRRRFNLSTIHSEYGMTELLSQAYSKEGGLFNCPPWMKVLIRDVNDPFCYMGNEKTGGVNVIDLANFNSCAFIETKDLGRSKQSGDFEVLGRFDNSDLRGCNLMIG
jgi:phenylacetate-coenzyme A ligase PaaK-like adenylate-forming protein